MFHQRQLAVNLAAGTGFELSIGSAVAALEPVARALAQK